jgi:hypothetical protein
MLLSEGISAADFSTVGPRLVGLTFIWAGAIKAIAPHTFSAHLRSLGRIPHSKIRLAVTVAAGLEVGWGLALLLRVAPAISYPFTIAGLLLLSSISWWGVRSGKTADCGCYGGFVRPSIGQSLGLNAIFIALVAIAWTLGPQSSEFSPWQIFAVVAGIAVGAAVAEYAQRFHGSTGRLLFDTNPLKIGNRWKHGFAANSTKGLAGEVLVAFLGPECPYCAQWVRIGNVVAQSDNLPRVIGVVASTERRRDEFVRDHGIKFPVVTISESLMGRLAQAVPTTVRVGDGTIRETWIGAAPPPHFVDRVMQAFFPEAVKSETEPIAAAN